MGRGGTIRKVMGRGAKIKIAQGKQKEKKFVHQESLKRKIRLFNRENYKLK
jgi:hypothetical protein